MGTGVVGGGDPALASTHSGPPHPPAPRSLPWGQSSAPGTRLSAGTGPAGQVPQCPPGQDPRCQPGGSGCQPGGSRCQPGGSGCRLCRTRSPALATGAMAAPHPLPALIRKKRDGERLEEQEIQSFIRAVTEGTAQQGQIGGCPLGGGTQPWATRRGRGQGKRRVVGRSWGAQEGTAVGHGTGETRVAQTSGDMAQGSHGWHRPVGTRPGDLAPARGR